MYLGWPLAPDNGQPLFRCGLVLSSLPAVLVLCLDVEDVLHVQLEGFFATGPNNARPLVNLKPTASCKGKKGQF